jgi:GNAT superfamily N-acetyltransferase
VSDAADIRILDVTDASSFALLPPCADPGFDHRSCDYWEDDVRGSKAARAAWWESRPPAPKPAPRPPSDNPFAPAPRDAAGFNPFDPDAAEASDSSFNPFAPEPEPSERDDDGHVPRKLRLLDRGRVVFGSYAKILLLDDEPAVYAQFGPLSAYPRAQQVRDLYPRLPSSPLPAVITCIATTRAARGRGLARALVEAVVDDLAGRGFAAIETYPDVTLDSDQASAASAGFWEACGFALAAPDERYPVMRRELG